MLLDLPLDSHPLEAFLELPSPQLLKRKIIIKNKKKHHHHHHHHHKKSSQNQGKLFKLKKIENNSLLITK